MASKLLKRRCGLLLLAILLCLLLPGSTLADAGPKPSMRIWLQIDGKPVSGKDWRFELLACGENWHGGTENENQIPGLDKLDLKDPSGCTWVPPSYPHHVVNRDGILSITGNLPGRFRLVVYSASEGRLWVSNAAERSGLFSTFTLDLLEDGTALLTERRGTPFERTWSLGLMVAAMALSLVLEIAVVLGYALWQRRRWQPLILAAVLGNILSIPFVWLLAGIGYLVGGPVPGLVLLAIGEFVAVFIEALLYTLIAREKFGRALLISLTANILSYLVGLLLH